MAGTETSIASDGKNAGPDQIFEASSYVTSDINGFVKLRLEDDTAGKNDYPPVSLPTLLIDAAKKSPNHFALGVKRDEKWVKWTYSEYLKGKCDKASTMLIIVNLYQELKEG